MDIDLNCDLGEGCPFDAELMPLITSANICCGLHAGSAAATADAIGLARVHGVRIGAHPGYDDRERFGRRELDLPSETIRAQLGYQIGSILGLTRLLGAEVGYIKPHGALYNQACRDARLAGLVAEVATQFQLAVVGLPGSTLEAASRARQLRFLPEGFADRRYRPDGSLVPRTEPNAFVHDPEEAVQQVEWLVREQNVRTICVHGDNPQAVAFARAVRETLLGHGFAIKPFG